MLTEAMNFAVVQTELDRVFYQEFDEGANLPSWSNASTAAIFKQMEIGVAAHIEQTFKGVDFFADTNEIGPVQETVPTAANKVTTYVKDFTEGVELSKNWFDDNMHGMWSKIVGDLARKARLTQDRNAFSVYRDGFTITLTHDGVAFFHAAHPLIGGGTASNLVTGALDPTTLNDAVVSLGEQKDQAGVIIGNQPACLLVPLKLFKKAIEVTASALIADNANNNINVYRSAYGITVHTSPYLGVAAGGSDTAWILLARNHGVTRIIRQGLQTALRDWSYSNNRTYFYQANYREETYVADWAGAVGSTGE